MRKKLIVITAGIIATEILWHLYQRYRRWKNNANIRNNRLGRKLPVSEVLMFSEDSVFCRMHANERRSCGKLNCAVAHLTKIMLYIESAKTSLDVCVYFFTCQDLSNAVVNVHKRGVRVRVILDGAMAVEQASLSGFLGRAGVDVRYKIMDSHMHHKFVIVDNSILITGSANWTMSAFFGNYENIIVTNQRSLVKPYLEEFDRMWIAYGHKWPGKVIFLKRQY